MSNKKLRAIRSEVRQRQSQNPMYWKPQAISMNELPNSHCKKENKIYCVISKAG